jgi:N-acyl-D-aspartate/D-glutamate deacylase
VLDLLIENGLIYDGSGAPGRAADLGIASGRIEAIAEPGTLTAAKQRLDARGRVVTPGFVDPHTHMDAQLWWEPSGSPSVLHGVTTIVIGSCGFGIAPAMRGQAEYVLRSLESVEEIPYRVTREAVPMTWTGWADYYEQLGALPLGVNVAGFVPHSALRVGVLGDSGRRARLDRAELDRLQAELREALDAGAVGFSTSRGSNHTDAHGDPVPSRHADDVELSGLIAECEGRIWQINIAAKGDTSAAGIDRALGELERYANMARSTGTRATWTPLVVAPGDRVAWRRLAEYSSAQAPYLIPQVSAQAVQSAIHFRGPSFAAMIDGWASAFAGFGDLDDEGRRKRLASPAFRETLRGAPEDCARITAPCFDRWLVGASPTKPDAVGLTVAEFARQTGTHPVDAIIELALADDLRTVIEAPLSNLDSDAVRELITTDATLIGLGDAGAHITSISNYSYPTFVLGELASRRAWMSIAEAVRRLTRQPADAMGLLDRGRLEVGARADVCVIDLERLALGRAELVDDLPGAAQRLHCAATGYEAVVVNGVVTVSRDRLTSGRAGMLARAGAR